MQNNTGKMIVFQRLKENDISERRLSDIDQMIMTPMTELKKNDQSNTSSMQET